MVWAWEATVNVALPPREGMQSPSERKMGEITGVREWPGLCVWEGALDGGGFGAAKPTQQWQTVLRAVCAGLKGVQHIFVRVDYVDRGTVVIHERGETTYPCGAHILRVRGKDQQGRRNVCKWDEEMRRRVRGEEGYGRRERPSRG